MSRHEAVNAFYDLLGELEENVGGKRTLETCSGRTGWPERGVYFFFEPREFRDDGVTPRVVRIGTHALQPSSSTLWGRLAQHRGTDGGSMPGGGSHRGSIFRRHVGAAILLEGTWAGGDCETWGQGNTARGVIREREYELELEVSRRIRAMPFLWVGVADEPSPDSDRGVIERGSIGLLSNFSRDPIDVASDSWLGRSCDRKSVSGSGLWNVNHVVDDSTDSFLETLSIWVHRASNH